LGVSLNAINYYLNNDETHRNLFVAIPGQDCPVTVTLHGKPFQGEVSLEGLPANWTSSPAKRRVAIGDSTHPKTAEFILHPEQVHSGEVYGFHIAVKEAKGKRLIPAQLLVAKAPLVTEAEDAETVDGRLAIKELPEASGGKIVSFTGEGHLKFDLRSHPKNGTHALWVRARWEPETSTHMTLTLDDAATRQLRAKAMIGFSDWMDARYAHTKMFAHFGEQYAHWSWYRIPDLELTGGDRQLTLGARAGAQFDVLVLLPQNPVMDRAAMNLFQNWNYAPWDNPM
jgi:hypothetical protein